MSVRLLLMPGRAVGSSHRSAYAPLYSKHLKRLVIAPELDHNFLSQRHSRHCFALPPGAFVCRELYEQRPAKQKQDTLLYIDHLS